MNIDVIGIIAVVLFILFMILLIMFSCIRRTSSKKLEKQLTKMR